MFIFSLFVLTAAAGCGGATLDKNQNTASTNEKKPIEREVEYGMKFREDAGFDGSEKNVRRLIEEYKKDKVNYISDYGTIWEKEELEKLNKRQDRLDDLLPRIEAYSREVYKNRYGGLYIEHKEDGAVYVGIRDGTENELELYKKKFGYENIKFFNVRHSEEELSKATDKLQENTERLSNEGINIASISVDVINNRVEIGLSNETSVDENKIKEILGSISFFSEYNVKLMLDEQ